MGYHWELEYRDGTRLIEPPEGQLWPIDHTRVRVFAWISDDGCRFEVQLPEGAFLLERKTIMGADCSWAAGYRLEGREVVLHLVAGRVVVNDQYTDPF